MPTVDSDRPIVLVTEGSDPAPLQWLRQHTEVIEVGPDDPAFDTALANAAGLVIRTYTRVDEALLDRAPKLRVVGRAGVGIDNIDVPACRRRSIQVVHTPEANTLAVGDFVFGVMLQLLRSWTFLKPGYSPADFKAMRGGRGRQLNELTLGILGMGRVGRRVGRIASLGFGMRVIYNDLLDVTPLLDFPAIAVEKPQLYSGCDVLSIHVDGRPENFHLVNADALGRMRPTAAVINTSRGEVLDAFALADALRNKRLTAAAIDVYDPEPPPADFPLLGLPNVLLTPHLAARTNSGLENMSWVVRDVVAVLNGQEPKWAAP